MPLAVREAMPAPQACCPISPLFRPRTDPAGGAGQSNIPGRGKCPGPACGSATAAKSPLLAVRLQPNSLACSRSRSARRWIARSTGARAVVSRLGSVGSP